MNRGSRIVAVVAWLGLPFAAAAQNIPVGSDVVEEFFRRSQLLGHFNSTSFSIRPLNNSEIWKAFRNRDGNVDSMLAGMRAAEADKSAYQDRMYGNFILPVTLVQGFNSHHAYSWNDGVRIPARGYQVSASAGIHIRRPHLSIRLQPEVVVATNGEVAISGDISRYYDPSIDLPQRFGTGRYSRVSLGQSHALVDAGPLAFGFSNENLWWGPGRYNALLMSNTAPGFNHLTLRTTRPVGTPIGSIEGMIIGGKLEGSGFLPKPDDWRYLSSMALSYQPRWVPGLFLGVTRSFQMYNKDIGGRIGLYFPLILPFQQNRTKESSIPRDQLTSLFARWVFPEAKAEVYGEYGYNDHSTNLRDLMLEPDHSRAYTAGFYKLVPIDAAGRQFLSVNIETTHMEQTTVKGVRNAGDWYIHSPVVHGYTNRGQFLGAGAGSGGSVETLNIGWTDLLSSIALQLEQFNHNQDFAEAKYGAIKSREDWRDRSVSLNAAMKRRALLFTMQLRGTQSSNYLFRDLTNAPTDKDRDVYNLSGTLSIAYWF